MMDKKQCDKMLWQIKWQGNMNNVGYTIITLVTYDKYVFPVLQ